MVWLHGGAFQQGSARRPEYDASRLAQEERVIVVTVNYRLGALGFLVSTELGLYGNYGLVRIIISISRSSNSDSNVIHAYVYAAALLNWLIYFILVHAHAGRDCMRIDCNIFILPLHAHFFLSVFFLTQRTRWINAQRCIS